MQDFSACRGHRNRTVLWGRGPPRLFPEGGLPVVTPHPPGFRLALREAQGALTVCDCVLGVGREWAADSWSRGPHGPQCPNVLCSLPGRCSSPGHVSFGCLWAALRLAARGQSHRCARKCPGSGPDCPAWSLRFRAQPPGAGAPIASPQSGPRQSPGRRSWASSPSRRGFRRDCPATRCLCSRLELPIIPEPRTPHSDQDRQKQATTSAFTLISPTDTGCHHGPHAAPGSGQPDDVRSISVEQGTDTETETKHGRLWPVLYGFIYATFWKRPN